MAKSNQCDSVYSLNGKKCCREKGHAGEHCHTTWDTKHGQRNEWWSDKYDVKEVSCDS